VENVGVWCRGLWDGHVVSVVEVLVVVHYSVLVIRGGCMEGVAVWVMTCPE